MPEIIVKNLPQAEVLLEVSLSAKELKPFHKEVANAYSQKNPLPGFRPGKATVEAVKKVIGQENFDKEVIEMAVNKTFTKTIVEKKLNLIGSPKIEVKENSAEKGLSYEAKINILPELVLPDLAKFKFKKPNLADIKVTEEELNKVLDQLRRSRAKTVTVNRKAQKGDLVEVNFKLSLDGVPVEGGSSTNHPLVIGEAKFIPGFEEQLIGLLAGEKKTFSLDFPKDYYESNLKGKKGDFEVMMKLVQEQELPELTDDFAKGLGRFTDAKNLKESLENNLKNEKEAKLIQESLAELIQALTEKSQVEIPAPLVEDEKKKMMTELEAQLERMGLNLLDYLEKVKTTQKDLLENWHEDAQKRVKTELMLMTLGRTKEIKAKEEEIEKEMEGIINDLRQDGGNLKELDPERVRMYAEGFLVKQKTIGWLRKEFLGV